ncbi:GIY-YIG nuclease family protein [Acidithiobacillus sp. AMEEHan]|uniref:GIY-YIG nuclease family protein n=1 Tax=Acidithiobacillus sp. AMEEHan TaxID=2994951 RepID=UPI0027E53FF8|nr:GIY-YIG nuclease family protein [Acidithiobacillus sp. AMEEHan]
MPIGKSIRIYLADATVSGIRYAEVVNWTGHAVACPRNRLGDLSAWPETVKPGVYFLFEARLGDTKPLAYIGESENVVGRLTSHDREKDFWNEAVLFTSKDENLTKAHVKFLEATLVGLARQADRYDLENGNTPPESSLPRADRDAMAEFTENIRMVLGTLGYPILEPLIRQSVRPSRPEATTPPNSAPNPGLLDLVFRVNNLVAHGTVTDEGFVLKKGSQVSRNNTDSAAARVVKTKEQLLADGRLKSEGDHLVLQEDFLLSSSSYAAVLVAGTSRSGPQSWLTADGRTLKAIEDAAIGDA